MYNISNVSESVISSVKVSNDFMEERGSIDNISDPINSGKLMKLSLNALPSYDTLNVDELLYIWEETKNDTAGFYLLRYCRVNNPAVYDMITKKTNEIRNEVSSDGVFKQVFPNSETR